VTDLRPVAVLDIDGVLADVRHRLRHVMVRPKDWDAFFAAAPDDPPLAEGLAVAAYLAADHDLVYLSGRPERCRDDTLEWLRRHDLPASPLRLRHDADRRPARVLKVDVLRRLSAVRAVAVLVDDDPEVCAAARDAGFTVLQATWMGEQPALREAQEQDGAT
jgi:phosphoglycolate phosphatase-like HAD superfamily hydrolase